MAPPALLPPLNAVRHLLSAIHGDALATFLLAVIFLTTLVSDDSFEISYPAATNSVSQAGTNSGAVVLSFTNSGSSAGGDVELVLLISVDKDATCPLANTEAVSSLELPADEPARTSSSLLSSNLIQSESSIFATPGRGETDTVRFARWQAAPNFTSAYRSIMRVAAIMGLPRIQEEAALSRTTIIGTISTYNPYRDSKEEGGSETASGELYNPSAWTAAVQTSLRDQFGGVRYGRLYQPAYALVVMGEKRLIVRVNDVGPLKPGRVLDLNERGMRYFDPLLVQGLIQDVAITLLPGEDWVPGPVGEVYAIDFAAARRQQPVESATEEAELASMRTRFGQMPEPETKADAHAETGLGGG